MDEADLDNEVYLDSEIVNRIRDIDWAGIGERMEGPTVVIDDWGKGGPYVTVTINGRTFTGILTEQEELE